MARITVEQQGAAGAPADLTYRLIADDEHHQHVLPEGFSDFEVLEGGVGAGTLHRFKLTAGKRVREYVMRVEEPEPGRVITETDQGSSPVTKVMRKMYADELARLDRYAREQAARPA